MTAPRAATADLVTGVILFALAVALIYGAWTMDRLEIRQIHPLTAPGLLPGLLGVALALCSALLIAGAVRARRRAAAAGAEGEAAGDGSPGNLAVATGLCLAYALVLVGWLPFWLATSLFVAAFIAVFEWPDAESGRARLVNLLWAAGIGLGAGLAISYAFSELFLVRLP